MLQQGMNSMGNMFGTSATPPAIQTIFSTDAFPDGFDPEIEADNPAYASEMSLDVDDPTEQEKEENWFDQEKILPERQQKTGRNDDLIIQDLYCDKCGISINEKVYEYSLNKFGRPLCMKCQKGADK